MNHDKILLDAISKETERLAAIVKANGFTHTETVIQSQKLDTLIWKYQYDRGEYLK
ncbi:aspartyl-phosphate phosphatase Spo0E family protein [Litchfieldia salsa]|uniref:Spo0E like sporulation regulatory protein n=1 Tax=Litchfieldia salsa TaxID=930152 RepID=A0A1H0WWZ2_9BACI|nr:aspartyl-phosphate phosphatase Spo0E family protein [Litchfieldia salsa]SDP95284.1 Spo0E like sporulation regulatory protein [Litchfieldia salsa]